MRFKAVSLFSASVVLGLALGLTGCGKSSPRITLSTTTSTSTTLPSRPTTTAATSLATTKPVEPVTANWVPATANLTGLASECGNLSFLSVRPDRDMLTVSVALRGLWASEKGSETWTPLGVGAGSATIVNRGSSIVYDPDRPNTFWESGIYNGGGVYRTDDNGVTFRQLGDVKHSDAVSVDLTDPQRLTLLASGHERTAVFVSRDGGQTWSDISGSLPKDVGYTSQPFVIDARTYLLGTSDAANAGIFRTTNAGSAWTPVFAGAVKGPPLLAKSDGAIYWVTAGGGLIKSVDKGVTWTIAAPAASINPNAPYVVELPDGALAAVGRTVIISNDRGTTWRSVGPSIPIQPNGFAYSRFRNAFYVWYFECGSASTIPVAANAILRLDFDYKKQ
jgi:photosystem II stability/assembly factor-like uncharacterized protein